MLWLSLYATLHFLSLQMFHKSTCISSGIMFTIMTLSTDSRWINERDLNSIWKSLEISSRSALKCINLGERLLLSLIGVCSERHRSDSSCSPEHKNPLDKTLSWRNKIRMHTFGNDYFINTLRFISGKEETQIYGAIILDSLTSPKMKETKAYKTYLGFAT
ncbi:hypothetical protein Tco_1006337 [Tanacetum coccineum]|uniref:Uncharacterized protein n=1 Tax=Tanacetum coccineum TaxID=301880 RepID=A0ABQ5FI05_9ASTR